MIQRILKRDKPITQVKKIAMSTLQTSVRPISALGAGSYVNVGGGDTGGSGGDSGSRVKVLAYGISGSTGVPQYVNRAQVEPDGAIYAVDDDANDTVKLRFSPLMSPLVLLGL